MRLFLDTSMLLAAAGSTKGASYYVDQANMHGWQFLSSPYCVEEARRNASKISPKAPSNLWEFDSSQGGVGAYRTRFR